MGYNYIEIKGSNEKLPPRQHFLLITRELTKPVKTKANKDDYKYSKETYDKSMKQREIMFEVFKTKFVDMHDRWIEPDDITKKIGDIVANNRFDNNIIYLIEPLIVSRHSEQYHNWDYKNRVHTFNIVKEITSIEELFDHAYSNNYYEEFMADIFDKMRYGNEGYKENCLKWFEYAKEKYPCNETRYPDCKLTLWDMIREHDMPKMEIVSELLDKELIYLHDKYDEESSMFKKLIQHKMFEMANKYLNLVQYEYAMNKIKSDRDSIIIMKSSSEDKFVKEILKFIGIEDKSIKVKITSVDSWSDKGEELTFEDINKAKAYIIKNYVVDFDKVADGIDDIYVYDDKDDEFHIEIVKE
jgi:hypothetical protein